MMKKLLFLGAILFGLSFAAKAQYYPCHWYDFSQSTKTYTEITDGTIINYGADTALGYRNIPLPFTFKYAGLNYNSIHVYVNGVARFADTADRWSSNLNKLASFQYLNVIAPLWDELYHTWDTKISYKTIVENTTDTVFVIQWKNIKWNGHDGTPQNFQIRLHKTSSIVEISYGTMTAAKSTGSGSITPSASIGINSSNDNGQSFSFTSLTPAAAVSGGASFNSLVSNDVVSLMNATTIAYLSGVTFRFTPPLCTPGPDSIVVSDIVPGGAKIRWKSSSSDFSVLYMPTSNTNWATADTVTTNSTSITLNSLIPSTNYKIRIVDNQCKTASIQNVEVISPMPIPWIEGFENIANDAGNAFPAGMKSGYTTSLKAYINNNITMSTARVSRTTPGYGYIQNFSSGYNVYMHTPLFYFKKDTLYRFTFSYMTNGNVTAASKKRNFSVVGTQSQFSTSSTSSPQDTVALGAPYVINPVNTNFEVYSIEFQFNKDTSMYLGIRYFSDATGHAVTFDNFSLIANPACKVVTNLKLIQVEDSSAKATWTPQAQKYERGFKPRWGGNWTIDTVNIASPDTVHNLEYGYTYSLQIRDYCNGKADSWSNIADYSTPCSFMTSFDFPYYRGFDLDSIGGIPNCWQKYLKTSKQKAAVVSSNAYNTPNSIYLQTVVDASSDTLCAILISPPISKDIDITTMQTRFMAKTTADTAILKIGIITDTSQLPLNYNLIDSLLVGKNYQSFTIPFSRYNVTTTEKYHIVYVLDDEFAAARTIYIDDLYIEEQPDCPDNSGFALESADESVLSFRWNREHFQDVILEYRVTGALDTTWISGNTYQTQNNGEISGLEKGTNYQVRLRTDCDIAAKRALYLTAKTFCEQPTYPWTESFENMQNNQIPVCMLATKNATPYLDTIQGDTFFRSAHTGKGFLAFNNPDKTSSITRCTDWVFTPILKLIGGKTYTFSFWYKVSGQLIWDPINVKVGNKQEQGSMTDMDVVNTSVEPNPTGYIQMVAFYKPENDTAVCFGIHAYTQKLLQSYICIDDLKIRVNACAEPINIQTSNITGTTAKVSWEGKGADYFVQYRKKGETVWSDSIITIDTNYTLTSLREDSEYEVRIRTRCGDTIVSDDWSNVYSFHTLCDYIKIPMFENFEGYTQSGLPACWDYYNAGNQQRAIIIGSYYHYSPSHCILMGGAPPYPIDEKFETTLITPPINPNQDLRLLRTVFRGLVPIPLGQSARKGGLIVGVMSNPQDISTFVPVDTVVFDSLLYNRFVVDFSSYPWTNTGNAQYIAYMHSEIDPAITGICLDDILIELIPPCADIVDVSIKESTTSSVTLIFTTEGESSGFEVEYRPAYDTAWQAYTPNMRTVEGLTPGIEYVFRVRSVCEGGKYGYYSKPYNYFLDCPAGVRIPYSEPFKYVPSSCWSYKTGTLSPTNTVLADAQSWGRKSFANNTANGTSIGVNMAGTSTAEWLISPEITVSEYEDHLLLNFDIALTKHNQSLPAETSGTDDKFVVLVSKDSFWNTADIIRQWSNNGTDSSLNSIPANGRRITIPLNNYTGKIRVALYVESTVENANNDLFIRNLLIDEGNQCPPPNSLDTTRVSAHGAAFTWSADGRTRWEVRYGPADMLLADLTSFIVDSIPTATITGLTGDTEYKFVIRTICNDVESSNWRAKYFFTKPYKPCAFPLNIEALNIAFYSFDVKWKTAVSETQWELAFCKTGNQDSLQNRCFVKDLTSYSHTGLSSNQRYEVRMRSICDIGDSSSWSTPLTVTTQNDCRKVYNMTTRVTSTTTAELSWVADSAQTRWTVEYGETGFVRGTGTKITVEVPKATLESLVTGRNYDAYITSVCTERESDAVKFPFNFTGVGIGQIEAESIKVSLAPNPAQNYVTLRITGGTGNVALSIFDISGKEVKTESLHCGEQFEQTLNLNGLAKGVYTVRLKHKDWIKTQRLIVQ